MNEVLRYKPKKSRVGFPMVLPEFFIDIILQQHCGPGVGSAKSKGGKGSRCIGPNFLKSDSRKFQGLSKPVQELL